MNTRGSMVVLGVAAVALLAHVSTTLGAGKITGLTFNPPDVKTCTFETVTVKGTGKCTSVTVFFGDGNKLITLGKPKPFPQTFHHVYSKGGLTRLSAQADTGPRSTCTGKASATVQIAAGPKPTITSMFTLGFFFSSDATPGALILLQGENFGDMPGQAWIHLKDYQGNASPHQLLDTQKYWADTFVAGIVPNDITKVPDQQATVTVVAQCGAVSNAQTVDFTAARDFVDLAYAPYQGFDCSMSSGVSDRDACEGQGSTTYPMECGGGMVPWGMGGSGAGGNLAGYHDSGFGFTGHDGKDQYWVTTPLQNGWVLLDSPAPEVTIQAFCCGQTNGGQVSADASLTSAPGTSSPRLGIDYHVNNCGAIFYTGHMIVTGPVGVPFSF